jgi:hypothetical protein
MDRKDAEVIKRFIDGAINNLKMAEKELLDLQRFLQQLKKVHPESLKSEEAIAEKYDSFLASIHAQEAQDVPSAEVEKFLREWEPTNWLN